MDEWDNRLKSEIPTPAVSPTGEKGFLSYVKEGANFVWKGVEITAGVAAGIIGFTRQIISSTSPKDK